MTETTPSPLNKVITIDDERIKNHLDRVVRGSVEETLNALLEAEADRLCNAQRYERSEARRDTRAGHYERKLQTKAGEVQLKVPKLRAQTFETAIIERYRRRESSVEEAADRDVSGGGLGAAGRGHHGGAVGHAGSRLCTSQRVQSVRLGSFTYRKLRHPFLVAARLLRQQGNVAMSHIGDCGLLRFAPSPIQQGDRCRNAGSSGCRAACRNSDQRLDRDLGVAAG